MYIKLNYGGNRGFGDISVPFYEWDKNEVETPNDELSFDWTRALEDPDGVSEYITNLYREFITIGKDSNFGPNYYADEREIGGKAYYSPGINMEFGNPSVPFTSGPFDARINSLNKIGGKMNISVEEKLNNLVLDKKLAKMSEEAKHEQKRKEAIDYFCSIGKSYDEEDIEKYINKTLPANEVRVKDNIPEIAPANFYAMGTKLDNMALDRKLNSMKKKADDKIIERNDDSTIPPELKYAIFVYNSDDDYIETQYANTLELAIETYDKFDKKYAKPNPDEYYVELWKRDKDGLFGESGNPIKESGLDKHASLKQASETHEGFITPEREAFIKKEIDEKAMNTSLTPLTLEEVYNDWKTKYKVPANDEEFKKQIEEIVYRHTASVKKASFGDWTKEVIDNMTNDIIAGISDEKILSKYVKEYGDRSQGLKYIEKAH
jgi:hypothetical protein